MRDRILQIIGALLLIIAYTFGCFAVMSSCEGREVASEAREVLPVVILQGTLEVVSEATGEALEATKRIEAKAIELGEEMDSQKDFSIKK